MFNYWFKPFTDATSIDYDLAVLHSTIHCKELLQFNFICLQQFSDEQSHSCTFECFTELLNLN